MPVYQGKYCPKGRGMSNDDFTHHTIDDIEERSSVHDPNDDSGARAALRRREAKDGCSYSQQRCNASTLSEASRLVCGSRGRIGGGEAPTT